MVITFKSRTAIKVDDELKYPQIRILIYIQTIYEWYV